MRRSSNAATTSAVSSVQPSPTTNSSKSRSVCARTERIEYAITSARLCVGKRTVNRGTACVPWAGAAHKPHQVVARNSPIRRVERDVLRDLAFPAVAVREQALLVVVKLLARLGRELEIRSLDDGIDRAGFLAQSAIDALHHVDVIARGAPGAVVAA